MAAAYQYASLSRLPDDTIRLLELHPGLADEEVKCSLITVQLTLRPKFAALSYVWGSEPASEEIELDGKPFLVRKNLWQCLVQLREPRSLQTIWIDAICVNQENVAERNQQVQFMNHIFGIARPVFAWLGNDIGKDRMDFEVDVAHFLGTSISHDKKTLQISSAEDFEAFTRLTNTVIDICKSKYWTRIWIVQEVMIAQQLFLCFGDQRVHWKDFRRCCDAISKILTGSAPLYDEPEVLRLLEDCDREVTQSGIRSYALPRIPNGDQNGIISVSLHRLISSHAKKEASDPRDKVYALLGLRKHRYVHRLRDRPPLRADYGKSPADLFFDVMMVEGLPDSVFAATLRNSLRLSMHDLQRASLSRKKDAFVSNMSLEAIISRVLLTKTEDSGTLGRHCHSWFHLSREAHESPLQESLQHHQSNSYNLQAFATSNVPVQVGDLVFRLQYSTIMFAFRYERSYFRRIARVERPMPISTKLEDFGCLDQCSRKYSLSLTELYAPAVDFEIWSGIQEIEYGPDVLLEVMGHPQHRHETIYDTMQTMQGDDPETDTE